MLYFGWEPYLDFGSSSTRKRSNMWALRTHFQFKSRAHAVGIRQSQVPTLTYNCLRNRGQRSVNSVEIMCSNPCKTRRSSWLVFEASNAEEPTSIACSASCIEARRFSICSTNLPRIHFHHLWVQNLMDLFNRSPAVEHWLEQLWGCIEFQE